jgi:hypothetical protein
LPEYEGVGYVAPPAGARWDPYGKPETPEAIEHEISLIQKQVEALQKEIGFFQGNKYVWQRICS